MIAKKATIQAQIYFIEIPPSNHNKVNINQTYFQIKYINIFSISFHSFVIFTFIYKKAYKAYKLKQIQSKIFTINTNKFLSNKNIVSLSTKKNPRKYIQLSGILFKMRRTAVVKGKKATPQQCAG